MYKSIESLPSSIREAMPQPGLELYRATFNRAWEIMSAGEAKAADEINAEAHQAALLAVEEKFCQNGDCNWQLDPVDS